MSNEPTASGYDNRFSGYGYDLLSRLVFASVGGLEALRTQALAEMELRPGMRILELGCGTGAFTRRLLERGAEVTAVDRSEPMLGHARHRAPRATFAQSELTAYQPKGLYDRVLFSFVLHELEPAARHEALVLARRALTRDGAVAIVDHAVATKGVVARATSAFVHAFELPTMADWIRHGIDVEVRAAGLVPEKKRSLACGTAVALLCRCSPRG